MPLAKRWSHHAGGRQRAYRKKVWVTEDGVVGWEYNEPFATLLRAHGAPEFHLIVQHEADGRTEAQDGFEPEDDAATYHRGKPWSLDQGFPLPEFETEPVGGGSGI